MDLYERDIATDLGLIRVRTGGSEQGTPMLFWPSLLLDGRMWLEQAKHFSARPVVLVDPPGHGGSEPLTATFDFDTCVHVLVQILDALGIDRVHHVGNSWGAMVGVTLAARHPNRVATASLLNGTASPAGRRQRIEYEVLVRAIRLFGFRGLLAAEAVDAFTGPTSRNDRPYIERTIRLALQGINTASVGYAVRSVVPLRPDQRPLLADITAPVLVIAGGEDSTFPVRYSKEMADGIAGSELVVIPDVAHLAALEEPGECNKLIEDFLTRRG